MKAFPLAACVLFLCSTGFAGKPIFYVVTDNHPTGGAGATKQQIIFQKGDRSFKVEPGGKGPGQCSDPFLGGFAFGHPDPRIKDPSAVCGHGYVIRLLFPINGPSPLSILPIEAPMPVENDSTAAADAAKLIRELLPKLDKSEGDQVAAVVQLRQTLKAIDSLGALKNLPKRQAR